MKLLYVTTGCFDKGGISRYNRYQICACREIFGADNVKVLSLLGPSEDDFEDEFKVDWHGQKADLKSKLGLIKKLVQISFQWRPDFILTAHINLSGVSWFASRFCNATTIMNAYGLEMWSPLSRDAAWGFKKVNFIISDCFNTADWIIKKKIKPEKVVKVIWDCVDLDRFYPGKTSAEVLERYQLPSPDNHFNILTLGRLSLPDAVYKGYERLVRAFARVAVSHGNARLIIGGRGGYVDYLKDLIAELCLEKKVFFTGSIREEDLAAIYNVCHIFSLITESGEGKGEGIPLTPLEAMACGKPILVGDQDGSREAIIDDNGFLMDSMDVIQQTKAINTYIEDAGLLNRQSEKALTVASRYFSYPHFKSKHVEFFTEIANFGHE